MAISSLKTELSYDCKPRNDDRIKFGLEKQFFILVSFSLSQKVKKDLLATETCEYQFYF